MRYTPDTVRAALAARPTTVVVDNPWGCPKCSCDDCTVYKILHEADYRHYTGGLYLAPGAQIAPGWGPDTEPTRGV